jgi:hypothetical protein
MVWRRRLELINHDFLLEAACRADSRAVLFSSRCEHRFLFPAQAQRIRSSQPRFQLGTRRGEKQNGPRRGARSTGASVPWRGRITWLLFLSPAADAMPMKECNAWWTAASTQLSPLNRRLETRPLPPPPRHDRRGARYRPLSSDHRGRAATTTPPPLATEVARPPLKLSTKLHDDAHGATLSSTQGYTYRTGGPNRRPPVTVYRSVSRGYRCLPSKFKFSNLTASHSVTHRFTDRFGPVTDRLGR